MKLAIITDIHGNEPALKAVLSDIDKKQDIDEIWCLGDMIAMGPDTNEVLDLLFSRPDIQMITGNHDEAILSLKKGEGHPESYKHTYQHHQWIADQLSQKNVEILTTRPRVLQKNINGIRIFGIHYHIEEEKRSAHIKDEPFHSILEGTLENMEKMYSSYPADIICFGHHHPQHNFSNDKQFYLNPGALGVSKGTDAPYAIIDVSSSHPSITIHHVDYDKKSFLEKFEKLDVPQREVLFKLFYVGQ